MKYEISKEKRDTYRGIIILNEMIEKERIFKLVSDDDNDKYLESLFVTLASKGLIEVKGNQYIATQKGQENLDLFYKHFEEFVRLFKVYVSVDTAKGIFAYEKYWDFDTDEAWLDYLNSGSDWEDVRVAVAEFKSIDPAELIFMSFIDENRFDLTKAGWQFDLTADLIWDEIQKIWETNIHADHPEMIDGDALKNIIVRGAEIAIDLLKEEDKRMEEAKAQDAEQDRLNQEAQAAEEEDEYIVEERCYDPYYDNYYDPFYISPIWLLLLL